MSVLALCNRIFAFRAIALPFPKRHCRRPFDQIMARGQPSDQMIDQTDLFLPACLSEFTLQFVAVKLDLLEGEGYNPRKSLPLIDFPLPSCNLSPLFSIMGGVKTCPYFQVPGLALTRFSDR